MGKLEASELVQRLMIAFRQDVHPGTIDLYAEKLADIPTDTLKAAVEHVIENQTFFPAVSELRRVVATLCGTWPATAAEVLALTRRADVRERIYRRDGSFAYEERYWRWPDDADRRTIELARETLVRVGEPCAADGKDYFAWETDFKHAYAPIHDAEVHEALADLSHALLPAARRKALDARTRNGATCRSC